MPIKVKVHKASAQPAIVYPLLMVRESYPDNPALVGDIFLIKEKRGALAGTLIYSPNRPHLIGHYEDCWSCIGMVPFRGSLSLSN